MRDLFHLVAYQEFDSEHNSQYSKYFILTTSISVKYVYRVLKTVQNNYCQKWPALKK